jgi:hypothetical protein
MQRDKMKEDCAISAIEFALETEDGLQFLRCWMYGEFNAIRKEWPECPESVFMGAEVGTQDESEWAQQENKKSMVKK